MFVIQQEVQYLQSEIYFRFLFQFLFDMMISILTSIDIICRQFDRKNSYFTKIILLYSTRFTVSISTNHTYSLYWHHRVNHSMTRHIVIPSILLCYTFTYSWNQTCQVSCNQTCQVSCVSAAGIQGQHSDYWFSCNLSVTCRSCCAKLKYERILRG